MIQLTLNKDKKYLLACSFGPDSMALFHLLRTQGYNFDCAIVNYHLRKESDLEVQGLLEYAKKYFVKVHVEDVKNVPTKNIESICRQIRYEFFSNLSKAYGYDAVLVAHHQDDLIETYLMQKERQNCPIYFGIKENTVINGVSIIRPLLGCTKQELLNVCRNNHVPFSVDKTNFDITIKRNKIRHEIVSKLDTKKRAQLLKKIEEENSKLLSMYESFKTLDLHDVQTVLKLEPKSQKYALNLLLSQGLINSTLTNANVGQVLNVLKSNKPNAFVCIKRNVFLLKEYGNFCFLSHDENTVDYSYLIDKPGKLETPFFSLDFTGDASNRNVSKDDYPLTIRNIKNDDVYQIKDYEVKSRRLLIDWKVPKSLRSIWPVIINKDNKIVYIPRFRKDFKPDINCNFYVKISR